MMMIALIIITAYLIGSIPNAVWIGRMFFGVDVRNEGSRNAGATNTIRVLGLKPGLCVLMLDLVKGLLPLALLTMFGNQIPAIKNLSEVFYLWFQIATAITIVVGHVFPIFVGFRGGKGVATLVGVLIMLYTNEFLFVFGIFLLVFLLFRYVSLSSICASISLPLLHFAFFQTEKIPLLIFALFIAVFIPITHIKNIQRLIHHKETKFVFKKKDAYPQH